MWAVCASTFKDLVIPAIKEGCNINSNREDEKWPVEFGYIVASRYQMQVFNFVEVIDMAYFHLMVNDYLKIFFHIYMYLIGFIRY